MHHEEDDHIVGVPVVHAVRGSPVVDVAELVVLRQVKCATTNLSVFSTTVPPILNQLSQEMLSKKEKE